MNKQKILQIEASGRYQDSVTRNLSNQLLAKLVALKPADIIRRDLAAGLPFVDEPWIAANFTPDEERNAEHKKALELSDQLVDEIKSADQIIIATPIYNFSVPAALKAWIDMVARARLTFQYTENGPVGMLKGKKAYLVVASGGTPLGGDMDFATGYLKHVLGFLGIDDVTLIDAAKFDINAFEASLPNGLIEVAQQEPSALSA